MVHARQKISQVFRLPHYLGLDAALIAVTWQSLLAQHWGFPLWWPERAGLFFVVWGIYLLDRLFDRRNLRIVGSGNSPTARHSFALANLRWLTGLCLMTWITALLLGIFSIPAVLIVAVLPLSAVCGVYFWWVHGSRHKSPPPWEKALVAAVIFCTGVSLAPFALGLAPPKAPAAGFLMAGLPILINFLLSAEIESHYKGELFGISKRLLVMTMIVCSLGLAAACLMAEDWRLPAAGLMAIIMMSLAWCRSGRQEDTRAVVVDLALLAPAVFLFI
jgi:hypothetical protein